VKLRETLGEVTEIPATGNAAPPLSAAPLGCRASSLLRRRDKKLLRVDFARGLRVNPGAATAIDVKVIALGVISAHQHKKSDSLSCSKISSRESWA
jgi:hypothetical protein